MAPENSRLSGVTPEDSYCRSRAPSMPAAWNHAVRSSRAKDVLARADRQRETGDDCQSDIVIAWLALCRPFLLRTTGWRCPSRRTRAWRSRTNLCLRARARAAGASHDILRARHRAHRRSLDRARERRASGFATRNMCTRMISISSARAAFSNCSHRRVCRWAKNAWRAG